MLLEFSWGRERGKDRNGLLEARLLMVLDKSLPSLALSLLISYFPLAPHCVVMRIKGNDGCVKQNILFLSFVNSIHLAPQSDGR